MCKKGARVEGGLLPLPRLSPSLLPHLSPSLTAAQVRALKATKGDKDAVKALVDQLMALKVEYKDKAGKDYGAPAGNMTRAGNVFSRAYAGATVALDCDTFTASFTPAQ